ncbi:MAG: ABC transporter ATP-binding protein [Actinobacteria bacterium]|nr:ABC transporter ATP-binding protein [Actinomycetota bacterium]
MTGERRTVAADAGGGAAGRRGGTLLEGAGLHKSYRRGPEVVHALRGATFTLRAGEVIALVGPSGSGKTTLLNVLAGWEDPEEGEIAWAPDGDRAVAPRDRPWSELAIVPQDLGLLEELSVRENVELPLRLGGRLDAAGRDRAAVLLARMGLAAHEDRRPSEVSLGEQQRVALCRALALSPRLLLADEPTGHQDAGWARAVFRAFRQAAEEEGTCCLVATHSREFLKYVDEILAIRDGEVHPVDRPEATESVEPPADDEGFHREVVGQPDDEDV